MLLCLVWIGSEPSRTSNARCREIFDMFDETVCGGSDPEVKGGKPAPDGFLVTAKRLSADPDQCLVVSSGCRIATDFPSGRLVRWLMSSDAGDTISVVSMIRPLLHSFKELSSPSAVVLASQPP